MLVTCTEMEIIMDNKSKGDMINDIVAMLDNSIAKGVGHMNISADEINDTDTGAVQRSVEQLGCLDCAKGDLACSVPTLHEGIDSDEEE